MSGRILIVDDDLMLSETIENYLSLSHFEVFLAASTDDAIQSIIIFKPQFIICECCTDAVNGFAILDFVKNNEAYCDIFFTFLTSKNQHKDALIGLAAGADAYLTKPFDFETLQRIINKFFASKKDTLSKVV